jgi:hypothetical protein
MSYELCFWRANANVSADPRDVYTALMAERGIDGLVSLPIEMYLTAVMTAFPSAVREPSGDVLTWQNDDQRNMFEITWSPVHIRVDLRPLQPDNANRLIEIAAEFDARLYDPQTGERFDT